MTSVSYPGVYIQEIPSGSRAIAGVPTSVGAFVGFTGRGALDEPVQLFSFGDYERNFGGLHVDSPLSYAVRQFFLNGGAVTWVVPIGDGGAQAFMSFDTTIDGVTFDVEASSEGEWGNSLRVSINYQTADPTAQFNLIVEETEERNGQIVAARTETHRNLSLDPADARFAEEVVNAASALVEVEVGGAPTNATDDAADAQPLPSRSTISAPVDFGTLDFRANAGDGEMTANLAGDPPADEFTIVVDDGVAPPPASLEDVRDSIAAALQADPRPALSGATVEVAGSTLRVTPGGGDPTAVITFAGGAAALLLLDGGNATQTPAFATITTQGADPGLPGPNDFTGSRADKTGIYALEDVRLFNILNLPGESSTAVLSEAIAYAEERRSMILLDLPETVVDFDGARSWITDNGGLRHRNAVAYFPRVQMADPLRENRLGTFDNSGLMAGVMARTDSARGVWKAPAGIDARLRGVEGLEYELSDPENGVLNPLGLNALRNFPVFGNVSWGARTMVGADELTSEWKYVPVRRLTLFIEESLYRGTQFVVFEPNDEPLWGQIRLAVGSFMNNLFRQGAFQGASPDEAYLVQCDSSTTTQADIDLGIVNIRVGFAPLKPAEFVIIQIQQLAGQTQA